MEIKLQKLKLTNFKGLKDYELSFNEGVTSIGGANGVGKTTIADAIHWVLFDKNYAGSSKFTIKTLDENGKVIPNIEHSVSLTLSIDGVIRDIRKEYKEVWKSYRGEEAKLTGHTCDFYIDGEVTTKGDYDAFIASFISEGKFRAITNPTYFFSLTWKEQRSRLIDIVGEVSDEELNPGHVFDEVLPNEQFKSIDDLLKHLSYNIKNVKDECDIIPALIKEQNTTKPEGEDFDTLRKDKERLSKELEEYKGSLLRMQQGDSESVARKSLRAKLEFAQKRMDNIVIGARKKHEELMLDKSSMISKLKTDIKALENKMTENKLSIGGAIAVRYALTNRMKEYDEKKVEIDEEYKEVCLRKFEIQKDWTVCPTCGREFDKKKIEEITESAKATFNKNRAKRIEEIKQSAEDLKKLIEEGKETIAEYNKKIEVLKSSNTDSEKKLAELNKKLNVAYDIKVPEQDELVTDNSSYAKVNAEIKDIEAQLSEELSVKNSDKAELINEIREKISTLESDINALALRLMKEEVIKSHDERIEELTQKQGDLNQQLATLYRKQDLAKEFQKRQGELLEEKVNKLFKIVTFRLFKEHLNENIEPSCEAWINNVPYNDVNAAAKLNGGLDIINTLCEIYGVTAPITIDNAESTTEILPTKSQQIRLYVTNSKELKKL